MKDTQSQEFRGLVISLFIFDWNNIQTRIVELSWAHCILYSAFYNAFDIFEVENGTTSTYIILHLNNKGELGRIVIFTYNIDVNLTRKNENTSKKKRTCRSYQSKIPRHSILLKHSFWFFWTLILTCQICGSLLWPIFGLNYYYFYYYRKPKELFMFHQSNHNMVSKCKNHFWKGIIKDLIQNM